MTAATSNFGAYLLQPIGNNLLMGCGNSPGNENGCQVFRSTDGATFSHEYAPSEQGANVDGQLVAGEWWVCGQDPTDDWTLGNIYQRSAAGAWSKIRTLPNVIHALGLWHDGGAIYVAAGTHTGDNATWRGQVLKSSDSGTTWTAVDVNDYRCYDVIGFDSKLYAVGYTAASSQDLHVSTDSGATWSKVEGVTPEIKPRLIEFGSALIGVQSSFSGVFAVAAGGTIALHATPFTLSNQWNVLADGGDGYLYALSSNGVWRSADLSAWQYYAAISNPISIALWTGVGLMVSDLGLSARIWTVPIN